MKKYFATIVVLFLVVLSGCSTDEKQEPTIVFKGEGSDWKATYNYYKVSDNSYDYEFILTYKGNKQQLMDDYDQITMEYGVGTNRMGGTLPVQFLHSDNKTIFKNSGSFEGVNLLKEDSKIDLYIKWGNNIDSFILTKES